MFKNLATLVIEHSAFLKSLLPCTPEHPVFIIIKEGDGEACIQGYLDPSCLPPEQSDLTVASLGAQVYCAYQL